MSWSSGADKAKPRAASGALVAAELKERLKTRLWSRGIVSIQQKLCNDHSMAAQHSLSRAMALVMNTLLGTSQRERV